MKLKPAEYVMMFVVLLAFSAAEFGASRLPLQVTPVRAVLVLLVVTQTLYFVLISMHLKDETRVLRRVAALPLVLGALYALVLVTESTWRHL